MKADWRERLLAAIDADGRSDEAISRSAGLNENFVHQLRNGKEEPRVAKVLRLAEELKISRAALFLGADITAEEEELLRLFRAVTEEYRAALLTIVMARRAPDRKSL